MLKEKADEISSIVVKRKRRRNIEHRIWIEVVFNVVRFLVVNGLPFRGHTENTDFQSNAVEGGVYINTLTFQGKPTFQEIVKRLPANAYYMSSDILGNRYQYELAKSKIARVSKN